MLLNYVMFISSATCRYAFKLCNVC